MTKRTAHVETVIRQQVEEVTWKWLEENGTAIHQEKNAAALQETFNLIPRKTGHDKISYQDTTAEGLFINGWTTDRLCRVWLIMQVDPTDKTAYLTNIGKLFSGASMNELVALYSALPVLACAPEWKMRCAEGIRSNIGTVLEAIMYENDYPFQHLDEAAFNQMVLKAFFTDKQVDRIRGLDQRANADLARILFDYAHERWAADRSVDPQLWRLTGKFLDAGNFADIQKLWRKGNSREQKAALLACSESNYPPAMELFETGGPLKKDILEKKQTWHNLNG
jgi:hypothetical protein